MSNEARNLVRKETDAPRILIIGGPNGAGKTTFALEFLIAEAVCPAFVNADLIAAGLSPLAPEFAARKAARIMLEAIGGYVRDRESFAVETTLSGRAYAQHIPEWRALGYQVKLFFLRLPSAEMAMQRVAQRVRQGGHDISPDVTMRRFASGWKNFEALYKPLVDSWVLFDNSTRPAAVADWSLNPQPIESATDSDLRGAWAALQRASATAKRIALQTGTTLINVEFSETSENHMRSEPTADFQGNP